MATFKIGDSVKVVKQGLVNSGNVGKVTGVWWTEVVVKFPSEKAATFHESSLEKLTQGSQTPKTDTTVHHATVYSCNGDPAPSSLLQMLEEEWNEDEPECSLIGTMEEIEEELEFFMGESGSDMFVIIDGVVYHPKVKVSLVKATDSLKIFS